MNKVLKFKKISIAILIGFVYISINGCQDALDDKYIPTDFYLEVLQKDTTFKDSVLCRLPIRASSSWKPESTEDWCTPKKVFHMGNEDLVCDLILNRGDEPRKCIIYVYMTTANKEFRDSVVIIQEVSMRPEVSSPTPETQVSSKGGEVEVVINHNFGVNFAISPDATGDVSWIELPSNIVSDSKEVLSSVVKFNFDLNTDIDRELDVILTSTQEGIKPYVMRFSQKTFAPAITSFVDDFEDQTLNATTGVFNADLKGWGTQSTFSKFIFRSYYHSSVTKAVLLNMAQTDLHTAWLITPPINVSELAIGNISVKIGSGNTNPTTDGESIKIVYSTDFDADASKATWIDVIDATIAKPAMGVMKKHTSTVPADIVDHKRVTFAIQYTAKRSAYRLDEFVIE